MNRRQLLTMAGGLLAILLLAAAALAASMIDFNLAWHAIVSGGGHSSSADYALDGSAGQPAADTLSSADFRVEGGFWPVIGAETPTPTPTGSPPPTSTPTATSTPTPTVTGSPPPTATPTATPTLPPVCQESLINGDFETGSLLPWGSEGAVGLGLGHNSTYGAWLGGTNNAAGELWQGVAIPADANSVPLEFWWLAESTEEQPGDAVDVIVQYDEQADLLRILRAEEPLGQWRHEAVDLTAYAGQTVLVTFYVHTDDEVPSTFRLDDVSLKACGVSTPTPTSTPTGTVSPTPAQRVYLAIVLKNYP